MTSTEQNTVSQKQMFGKSVITSPASTVNYCVPPLQLSSRMETYQHRTAPPPKRTVSFTRIQNINFLTPYHVILESQEPSKSYAFVVVQYV